MKKRLWQLAPPAPPEFFRTFGGLPPLIAQILYNRDITEPERIRAFLTTDPSHLNDPCLLPGMDTAVARLKQAIDTGQTVAVYGDYDLDGISATAILVKGLIQLGAKAVPYIPHRLNGGYGLKLPALKKLRQQGADLVVSVDCGVTAVPEVAAANKMGLDIIVTDHHLPRPELPAAVAVVDPRLPGADYPCPELTGAGISFKLLQAVWREVGRSGEPDDYYDMAALGTVADIAPILDENRYLVRRGLEQMNGSPRPGIRQMLARSSVKPGTVTTETISWVLAPRLNAVGRLGHAMAAYKLLMTDDDEEAEALSFKLEQRNRQRQDITGDALEDARVQVEAKGLPPLLFAASPDYAAGIVGLVAGRLSDEFDRPSVVVSVGKEISRGSCRSVPGFNIAAALSECAHLLQDYGGHKQAAGFSLSNESLEEFEAALLEVARRELEGIELKPEIRIDYELDLARDGEPVCRAVPKLAPFGEGNPPPVFLSRNLKVISCDKLGKKQEHLRLRVKAGDRIWEAMAFRAGERADEVGSRVDIVYNLEIDWWKGVERLRLLAQDFAPSA